jgi:hypothetical protein
MDEYCLFYNFWSIQTYSLDPEFWLKQQSTHKYATWTGFSFENLCLKNIKNILQSLGIGGLSCHLSTWRNKEAQIDFLIERSDRIIHLCEVKYSKQPIKITSKLIKQMNVKKIAFQNSTNTKKQIFLTLITNHLPINRSDYQGQIEKFVSIEDGLQK